MTPITRLTTAVVEANFDYVFVRLHTGEGVHGTGECFFAPGIVAILADLEDLVLGQDPRQVQAVVRRIRIALSGPGSPTAAGIAYNALSGIEAALWDLAGKLDNRPVSELLGGRFVDEVPVYIDCHAGGRLESMSSVMRSRVPFWLSPTGETTFGDVYYEASDSEATAALSAWADRASSAVALGFRILKFDLDTFQRRRRSEEMGASPAEIRAIRERAQLLRRTVGDDVDIAFDCHWRFDIPTALAVAEAVADVRPIWFEDPVPYDVESLAAVQRQVAIPIAAGETAYLVEGFRPLIDAHAVSIVTPDAQKCGGLAEMKRIFDDAALRHLQAAPHCIASPLGLMATAHVSAASTNVVCIEFHGVDVPFWHELVDGPVLENGVVRLPHAPGIGVELNEDVVRQYSRRGLPVFE